MESEVPAEVAEKIDLGFQVENQQQGNTPVTSTTTAAEPRPVQTGHGRNWFDNNILLRVYSINGTVPSMDLYMENILDKFTVQLHLRKKAVRLI